jgi:hypothetical protein
MTRVEDGRQRVGRRLVNLFGLAATAMLMLSAAPSERASAMSLINPASAPSARHAPDELLTEVRHGGGGGGYRGGGGGGFRGGGYRGGAVHFSGVRSGGYRAGPVFHGGGYRYGGYRAYHYGGYHFARRHHFHHRRFFYGSYYDYPSYYYYPRHRCRVIWTYHGPRRVCRWPHRHHRHHWRVYW